MVRLVVTSVGQNAVNGHEHNNLGGGMPEGWNWRRGSAFARYEKAFGKNWEKTFLQSRK